MFYSSKLNKDELAQILETSSELLEQFEASYRLNVLPDTPCSRTHPERGPIENPDLINRIVAELLEQTQIYRYDGGQVQQSKGLPGEIKVSKEEIRAIPTENRPQLTGHLICKQVNGESAEAALFFYKKFLETGDMTCYGHFRQGLDILDLDPVLYEILGMNRNSMGHWFPQLVEACRRQNFFKIPATTIAKVPITLLQLSRLDYGMLTPATLKIADLWAMKAFELDTEKEYFIKTGLYSSKFDFRNAYVHGEKEVRELGEYLVYIHNESSMIASPTNKPFIYGAATTNEWVVREFIHDTESNPCIYKGLPLHTEYRVFVDCDADQILGVYEYWDPALMKYRFSRCSDADSPHQIHDYMVFKAHEKTMGKRFRKNKKRVAEGIAQILPTLNLEGQWSIDVMQNGDDFWLIDMALAQNSTFFERVPEKLRGKMEENWIPRLPEE